MTINFKVLKVAAALVVGAVPPSIGAVAWLDTRTEVKARRIAEDLISPLNHKVTVTGAVQAEQISSLKDDVGEIRAAQKEQREDTKELLRILRRQEKQHGK